MCLLYTLTACASHTPEFNTSCSHVDTRHPSSPYAQWPCCISLHVDPLTVPSHKDTQPSTAQSIGSTHDQTQGTPLCPVVYCQNHSGNHCGKNTLVMPQIARGSPRKPQLEKSRYVRRVRRVIEAGTRRRIAPRRVSVFRLESEHNARGTCGMCISRCSFVSVVRLVRHRRADVVDCARYEGSCK